MQQQVMSIRRDVDVVLKRFVGARCDYVMDVVIGLTTILPHGCPGMRQQFNIIQTTFRLEANKCNFEL